MAHTRTHSYCWAFCLSFACMFTWFVPVEALFSAPAPRPADDGGSSFSSELDQRSVPKQLVRDHQTVFGDSILEGAWAKKSGSAWDGLEPHHFVSLDGPSVFIPTTETDITAEVMAEAPPSASATRYISTTGWYTGSEGTFPVHFLVCSEGPYSLFFFTGMVPTELFMQPISDFGDGSSEPYVPQRCLPGVDELAQCDAQLDLALAQDGTQAAGQLRSVLTNLMSRQFQCLFAMFEQEAAAQKELDDKLAEIESEKSTQLLAAAATYLGCIAMASVKLAVCLAFAAGWSFFGLGVITATQAARCSAKYVINLLECTITFGIAVAAIMAIYHNKVAEAEQDYADAMQEAYEDFLRCLQAINRSASESACELIPMLSPGALAAATDHQSCYERIADEHADCLSRTGENALLDHGLHQALDTCGADG